MAKIIGIDLGTTYSAVCIWDEKQQIPVIIPNLQGHTTTPSVVSLNEASEIIVGQAAKQNLWMAPENTISEIKREMGTDFKVTMGGKGYNPQTISAFILRYLKKCAENYLGEPVHDAVITVPAYFTEVQKSATRDAGSIAGLNVHRLINEPTAAAISYSNKEKLQGDEEKIFAVYDLGGGTFDVSIIQITADDINVLGTGGDSRLGGLDMDEAVMKWALREIKKKYNVDLNGDESVKKRLKVEAEDVKKSLAVSENATLSVPFLTVIENKPLNVSLSITRERFEMLIAPLLTRSIKCLEQAIESAQKNNQIGWEDLDGILLVGGPTRLTKIQEMLTETLREHNPDKEPLVLRDMNPDEVVAMGAGIVAAGLTPIGKPPEEVEKMAPEEVEDLQEQQRSESPVDETIPTVDVYDVTGHSLGIAVEGYKFFPIIPKETVIPFSKGQGPFSNAADLTTQLLVEVYQGEEEFVKANTKVGEVKIDGLEPLPKGHQQLEVKFTLDQSGTLSTVCTDLRTGKTYEGSFVFDGVTRMSGDDIRAKREEVAKMMDPNGQKPPAAVPAGAVPAGASSVPAGRSEVPQLDPASIPEEFRIYWVEAQELLPSLTAAKQAMLQQAMLGFAQVLMAGRDAGEIENKAFDLQDAILDAKL